MLTLAAHFKYFSLALLIPSFIFIGGIYRQAPVEYIFISGCMFIGCWCYWWRRFKRENSMPTFAIDKDGINVRFSLKSENRYYLWNMVVSVELVSPFDRGSKGLLNELEGRPGYELSFNDGTKVMVYQKIEGYYEFYQMLASHDVSGVKDKLPYYDRLNIYGQSIDGSKWLFNDGKPSYTKSIILKSQKVSE